MTPVFDAQFGVGLSIQCFAGSSAFGRDIKVATDAAVQGIGVCLGRTPQINDHLRSGTLVAPIPDVLVSTRANYLIRSPDSDANPKVRHFLDWLTS